MVIEESVLISAELEKVWDTFLDLSCWKDWSSVVSDVSAGGGRRLDEGGRFSFCIRPFIFPVRVEPVVEKVVPGRLVVWSGRKLGVTARHEFAFEPVEGGVLLSSRESFRGLAPSMLLYIFSMGRLKSLTRAMLEELRRAAEAR